MGYCYFRGLVVNTDYLQASEWFKKGAEHGDASAQENLNLTEGVESSELKGLKDSLALNFEFIHVEDLEEFVQMYEAKSQGEEIAEEE